MGSSVTAYTVLYPLVTTELGGCPDPLLLQTFQQVGREFCRETEAWREELSPVNLVEDHDTYALPMPYDVMIRRILWLKTGGTDSDAIDTSLYDLVAGQNTVKLTNAADSDLTDGLVVKVVLIPYLFSSELAEDFMEKWGEGLCAGVKAKLMAMKNKTWSDSDRSVFYKREYMAAQADARFDNEHENKKRNVEIQYNSWAM